LIRLNKVFVCGSLLLSGCSLVSPTAPKPKTSVPESWSSFETLTLDTQNNLAYTAWWQYFHDPVLNQFMNQGLKENLTLKEADTRLAKARAQLKTIQLSWIPSLTGFAGYSSNPALGNPLGFYGLFPKYVLFNAFQNIALQKSAELEIAVEKKAIEAARLMVIAEIATSYYSHLAELNQLKLMNVYIEDIQKILTIQKATFKDGLSTKQEIDTLVADLHTTQAQRVIIQDNLIKTANALHYLLAQNPGPVIVSDNFETMNTSYPNVGDLPMRVLEARPDVAIAELQYRLSVQNTAKAYTSLLPAAQLDTYQGTMNVNNPNTLGTYANYYDAYISWTVDPTVFGQIDAYNASQKTAYYAYIDTVKKALQDVDNSLSTHDTANARYKLAYEAYSALQNKYELTLGLYKTGVISYQDTLKDKLNVDKAALDVNQTKLVQMLSLVSLYQELGGGSRYTLRT
jgi:outer membrane protein TolC